MFERNRFLIAFAMLSSIMGSSVGLAKVATSLYAVHLGAEEALLGMIASSQSVGVLIMSMPLGFLVERHGPERLFITGTLIAGALYLVVPLVPSATFLLGCTTAIGFFMPFRFVALNTVFLEHLLSLGAGKAGWYRGTHMAGMFLIGPLAAASAIQHLLYAGTFWLIAGAFALTILLSPTVFSQARERTPSRRRFEWSELRGRLALLGRDPELRHVCIVEFCAQAINNFFAFFIVVIAVTSLGFGKADAASIVAAQGCSYVIALISLGGLATRLGAIGVHVASCSAVALALAVLGVGTRLPSLWSGALLLGLGLGLLQVVNLTRFAKIGARIGQGPTAGINALVGPAGSFIGSFVGGTLGRSLGLQTVFLAFIPVVALLGWRLAQPRPVT